MASHLLLHLSFPIIPPFISLSPFCLRLTHCLSLSLSLPYGFSILNRSSLITFLPKNVGYNSEGCRHCLCPFLWRQPRRLALLGKGERKEKEGEEEGGRCYVLSHRESTKENQEGTFFLKFTSLIWCRAQNVICTELDQWKYSINPDHLMVLANWIFTFWPSKHCGLIQGFKIVVSFTCVWVGGCVFRSTKINIYSLSCIFHEIRVYFTGHFELQAMRVYLVWHFHIMMDRFSERNIFVTREAIWKLYRSFFLSPGHAILIKLNQCHFLGWFTVKLRGISQCHCWISSKWPVEFSDLNWKDKQRFFLPLNSCSFLLSFSLPPLNSLSLSLVTVCQTGSERAEKKKKDSPYQSIAMI